MILVIIVTVLAIVLTGSNDNVDPGPGPDPDPVLVAPDPPDALTRDDLLTNQEQVTFTWSAPINDGGAQVIDY